MTHQLGITGTFLFLLFSSSISLPSYIHACTPSEPDPWFTIALTLNTSTLPSGVEIVQSSQTDQSHALINRNPEPLYIVKENNTDWKTFPNSGLPRNYEPIYKLINSQSYYYFNDTYSEPPTSGYKPNSGGVDNVAASRVEIDEQIYTLDGNSKQIFEDNRPASVDIPTPQTVRILAYYQGQPLQITGTFQYSLNEQYDPKAGEKGAKACAELNIFSNSPVGLAISFLPVIMVLSFTGLVGFVVYVVIKDFRKR